MMEYKGYTGRLTALDDKQGILHGEVTGINDIVTFQGKTAEELLQAFRDSVDDYLAFCEERSETPEKPFSGKFLVRISPSLHQRASLAAKKAGESLNAWVASAIKAVLGKATPSGGRTTRERDLEDAPLKVLLDYLERSEARRPVLFGRPDPFTFGAPFGFPLEPDPIRSALAQLLFERLHERSARGHRGGGRRLHQSEAEEEVE